MMMVSTARKIASNNFLPKKLFMFGCRALYGKSLAALRLRVLNKSVFSAFFAGSFKDKVERPHLPRPAIKLILRLSC
jgi:hypothetical protein